MNKKTVIIALGVLLAGCAHSPFDEFKGWEKKFVAEAVDIGAFENPTFDDVSKFGKSDIGEIGAGFGFNGNGGLRIHPSGKTFSYRFPLKARLEKGKRYVFTADVRGHGKAWGKAVMDATFTNPRKYASGCGAWGTSSTPLADGWQHQEVEVVAKHEPEKIEYHFMIYGGVSAEDWSNGVHCVDVDNIQIRLAAPKWYFCNTWPAYNLVHADEGRVRFNSSFWGDFFGPEAKPVYACELVTAEGKLLGGTVCTADADGNFTADFGPLAYRGPAKVRVTLYDRHARQMRGVHEIDVTVAVPVRDRNLFIREDGVVLRDGKPYMPIGFYTSLADAQKFDMKGVEEHFKRLHDGGFNAIMDYQTYSLQGERRKQFYALAEKYGIGIIDDSFNWENGRALADPGKREAIARRAREIAAMPAHIGWYTMDEAPEGAVPHLDRLRRMLNEVAPGKVVNTCNIMRAAPYLPTADIQGGDSYPVKKGSGSTLMDSHERVSKVRACTPAAIWYAPQCYNWARMTKGAATNAVLYRKVGREPTMEEMLSVALCMVQDGTTGFLFYAYFDLIECPVPEYREPRWAAMVEIAKVLRSLEPFIMSGEKIVDLSHADKADETRVVALSDGRGGRRIIVCGLGQKHEATFTLPAEYGKPKSRLGHVTCANGTYTFTGGPFSCDILE